jgi:predicted lipid carrier protein YhbT
VATVEECEAAMHKLAERLRSPDAEGARGKLIDRSISCHLRDLDVTFGGQLRGGEILGIHRTPEPDGQIKLTTTSDDLVALVDGQLNFAKAFASGRLKIDASVFDLLKLRSLL